jgi:hypothetical protein
LLSRVSKQDSEERFDREGRYNLALLPSLFVIVYSPAVLFSLI